MKDRKIFLSGIFLSVLPGRKCDPDVPIGWGKKHSAASRNRRNRRGAKNAEKTWRKRVSASIAPLRSKQSQKVCASCEDFRRHLY